MTDGDFLERSKLRIMRLCSPVVLGGSTIGYAPKIPAEHKLSGVLREILILLDKVRWCGMLGADIPSYMAMRLAALEVLLALKDDDLHSVEWFRERILKLPAHPNLTKLHGVRERPEDFRTSIALAEILFASNWRAAVHGREFAYLSTAAWRLIEKWLIETEGEHIAAFKEGYKLAPIAALATVEKVAENPAAVQRGKQLRAALARAPVSVQDLISQACEYPRLQEYLQLRAAQWTRQTIAERPGWSWPEVKRVEKQRQRLLQRIEERGVGLPCRLLRPMGAISDASYTAVEERFHSGRSVWKHVNSEAWERP